MRCVPATKEFAGILMALCQLPYETEEEKENIKRIIGCLCMHDFCDISVLIGDTATPITRNECEELIMPLRNAKVIERDIHSFLNLASEVREVFIESEYFEK